MKLRKPNRINPRRIVAATLASLLMVAGSAFAQSANTPDGASMVKPPQATADGTNPHNPDNMPIKRPRKPTNDKMMRTPPASAANAK
jgi:hypothetical protein